LPRTQGRRLFSTNNKAGGNAALFEAEAAAGAEAEAGAADTPVNRALNTAALTLTASACIAGGALVWAQYSMSATLPTSPPSPQPLRSPPIHIRVEVRKPRADLDGLLLHH